MLRIPTNPTIVLHLHPPACLSTPTIPSNQQLLPPQKTSLTFAAELFNQISLSLTPFQTEVIPISTFFELHMIQTFAINISKCGGVWELPPFDASAAAIILLTLTISIQGFVAFLKVTSGAYSSSTAWLAQIEILHVDRIKEKFRQYWQYTWSDKALQFLTSNCGACFGNCFGNS